MQRVTGTPTRRRLAPIRWLREHPLQADFLLAATLTTISLTFHLLDFDPDDTFITPTWWTTAIVFASVFPIAWRRRNPVLSTAIVVVAFSAAVLLDADGSGFIGVVIALYSLGAHEFGPARTRAAVAAAALIGLLFVVGLLAGELDLGSFVSSTVVLVTAFVLGDNLRGRRLAADALQERLERSERERELLAHRRVTDERTRIARELHDVVAHSVTAMVIQASAARRSLERSPDDAAAALDRIESTGRSAMNELRSMLGVLRRNESDPDVRAPLGGGARLDELIASSSDLPIHLERRGRGPSDRDDDAGDAGVDLTVFRLVQEGLTNVRRHAGAVTRVDVVIERHHDSLTVTVTDDGAGSSDPDAEPGYGLVGLRERVDTIGGTLRAGPWGTRGWRLVATVPMTRFASIAGESSR